MKNAHRIDVVRWSTGSSTAWTVLVDGNREAIFMGRSHRDRAIKAAFGQAERLRREGPVQVVIEPEATEQPIQPRIAS
jgi:hypothetical protein